MPSLTDSYPNDAPAFIRQRPAPHEWQEQLQKLDERCWIAWNEVHTSGPRWCIVRFVGQHHGPGGAVLIDRQSRDGLLGALDKEWSYVRALENPDGSPCGMDGRMIHELRENDMRRRYGDDHVEALEKMKEEDAGLVAGRQAAHDGLMRDAFHDTLADNVILRKRTHGVPAAGA